MALHRHDGAGVVLTRHSDRNTVLGLQLLQRGATLADDGAVPILRDGEPAEDKGARTELVTR